MPQGVPPLLAGQLAIFIDPTDVLSADTMTGYGLGASPQWGIFLGANAVVQADTVTRLAYSQEWAIADYPVERGGFESYDKVNTPFRMRLQFVSGGSEAKRAALLESIEAISDTLTLYDVMTPEQVYVGVNVERYEYRREATRGLGIMVVDVDVLEIREEGITDFKNARPPSGYLPFPTGSVQPTATQSLADQGAFFGAVT
jgi:hypothetical protein